MEIDVWSDVVCPWCFIGKRRLDKALAEFEHRDEITVRHRAFQLQPDIVTPVPIDEHLATKYQMDVAQVKQMQDNVCVIADGEGLCYNFDGSLAGNTTDAHRLLLWSGTIGRQDDLLEAMYSAYFEKSQPVFTHEDLIAVTNGIGLSEAEVRGVLDSGQFLDRVREDQQLAAQLGSTGVPFFVFDMRYGISGAQPLEAFTQTLHEAWNTRTTSVSGH